MGCRLAIDELQTAQSSWHSDARELEAEPAAEGREGAFHLLTTGASADVKVARAVVGGNTPCTGQR